MWYCCLVNVELSCCYSSWCLLLLCRRSWTGAGTETGWVAAFYKSVVSVLQINYSVNMTDNKRRKRLFVWCDVCLLCVCVNCTTECEPVRHHILIIISSSSWRFWEEFSLLSSQKSCGCYLLLLLLGILSWSLNIFDIVSKWIEGKQRVLRDEKWSDVWSKSLACMLYVCHVWRNSRCSSSRKCSCSCCCRVCYSLFSHSSLFSSARECVFVLLFSLSLAVCWWCACVSSCV